MTTTTDMTQLLSDIAVQASTGIYQHADDTEFFATGRIESSDVRERILIERLIVRTAVAALLEAGHSITVYHEGELSQAVRTRDLELIMGEVCACDIETLGVFTPGIIGRQGFISLIYGNDGWDVMQDYTLALSEKIAAARELADAIGDAL